MATKIIIYTSLINKKNTLYRFRAINKKRLRRCRPRDEKKMDTLLKMDLARQKRFIKNGYLRFITPRLWELKI